MRIEEEISNFLKKFEKKLTEEIKNEYLLYPLLPPGKRTRPLLLYSASYPLMNDTVMVLSIAVELLHTSSLVHDDLPFVDDSAERRGKPASHIKYSPGIAVMIGDGLLAESFRIASRINCEAVSLLSQAAGMEGIAGGQILDLKKEDTLDGIYNIYEKKTVKLFRSSFLLGLLASGRRALFKEGEKISREIGFLFQIADDIIDREKCGSEPNIAKIVGEKEALKLAKKHYISALEASDKFQGRETIKWLIKKIIKRVSLRE